MLEIERLLIEVSAISKRYEQIARITGENFNIFKTLGIQSSEVRLHSAFLAELLNSKGSHGQQDKYLKLFLDHLKIERFDTTNSKAFVEFHTSKISEDGEFGGRIDILISDKNGKNIIIENKIYAGDQPKQLKRYKNFDSNAELFYLNLFGDKPSDNSCAQLIQDKDFKIISYRSDILLWLESCMKESVSLPIIRETIHQYIHLIKNLTNQATFNTMNNELKETIKKNPDYFKNVPLLFSAYDDLLREIKEKFFNLLEKRLNEERFESNIQGTDLMIQLQAGEDAGGVYFAYRLVKRGNNVRCGFSKESNQRIFKSIITKNSGDLNFAELANLVTQVIIDAKTSDWSLGWYNPTKFKENKKLHEMDDFNQYICLLDTDKCGAFIDALLEEAKDSFRKIILNKDN